MSASTKQLEAFVSDIGDISYIDDPKVLAVKSKDYFWYSPILKDQLDDSVGQLLVQPKTEEEIITVASAIARHRIPLTIRGGGTGNYGQCVPTEGGVVLEITKLNKVLKILDGRVVCEAGARIEQVEKAVTESGQMLSMFPSTKRLATMGGFVSGGSGGIGSLRNGMLRDGENITYLRIVTVEEKPRIIELHGKDILKAQHAYGTNGIITEMDYALAPAKDWSHTIALFSNYAVALDFAKQAQEENLDAFLMTVVERRFAQYYRKLTNYFPPELDAVFSMIAPEAMADYNARVKDAGGTVSLAKTLHEIEEANLPPAWECGWNHTTLQALKKEPSIWTYLQVAYPRPFDPKLVERQMKRYGDELFFHHEMARMDGQIQIFALPILRWKSKERTYEIIREMEEQDGCMIFDPHVITIEDGGMKDIDSTQIEFKKEADPYGLMNPGKTRGWRPEMARN